MILDFKDSVVYNSTNNKVIKLNKKGKQLKFNKNDLIVKSKNDSIFIRYYSKSKPTNITSFDVEYLKRNKWHYIAKINDKNTFEKENYYSFINDSIVIRYTDYLYKGAIIYNEMEKLKYNITSFKEKRIHVLTFYKDNGYSYQGQILKKSNDEFKIEFLNNINKGTTTFRRTDKVIKDEKFNYFSLCYDFNIGQYYYNGEGTNYKGGLKKIKKEIFEKYITPKYSKNQTGFITFRFIVNCKGEKGQFVLKELNSRYESFQFNEEIINQLFNIIIGLNEWNPGLRKNGTAYDNYKHLTFKLQDGKIIDILPK
ncbi:hypothetical protein UJ101_02041 [Flavobacteriaceae bacterium UJ101]|nr:hypothetical protein UJ101_02041 [Flavobacteriaceae bacterium UJ101]